MISLNIVLLSWSGMDGKVERKRVRLMRILICKLRAVEQLIFLDFVERVGMMAASVVG